jgi:hypothetical protein
MARTASFVVLFSAIVAASPAGAQTIAVEGARAASFGPWGLLLSVNQDDDDENLRRDDRQSPPAAQDDDVRTLLVNPPPGTATVAIEAAGAERFRVHAGGTLVTLPGTVPAATARLSLDGVRASAASADARLVLRFLDASGSETGRAEQAITVVGVSFLDAWNAIRDGTRTSLQFSNRITNDDSLPRGNEYASTGGESTGRRSGSRRVRRAPTRSDRRSGRSRSPGPTVRRDGRASCGWSRTRWTGRRRAWPARCCARICGTW